MTHAKLALTARERVVLELLICGLTNRAIADRVHVSVKSVESTIAGLYDKFRIDASPEVNRRVRLVTVALRTAAVSGARPV